MGLKKILVVDDEPELREILSEEFRYLGYEVHECSNGIEAWDYLQKNSVDIVVSDVRMPKGDGMTLLKNICSGTLKHPPLVYLLSGFSDVDEHEAQKLGAHRVFPKPFELRALTQAIKEDLP